MSIPNPRKKDRRSVREESRAVYRQAIMDAAIRIFGQTGYRDTKIADIATEAGVATGTLYNYFSSKEDIFQSILDDGREQLETLLGACLEVAEPLARLRAVVDSLFEFLEEHGALFTIYVQVGGDPSKLRCDSEDDTLFRRHILSLFATTLTEAGDQLRQDYPVETLALGLGGLINGTITDWIEHGCGPGLRAQTDFIFDMFLHGAKPR